MAIGKDSMTLRFAHAMVHVRNLDNAIAFYQHVLGLKLAERHTYKGAELAYMRTETGNGEIELLCEAPWRFSALPERGRCHIAFTVSDAGAEHTRLKALGCACGEVDEYRANGKLQTRFFYLYDPEGNEIEILESMGRYGGDTQ
jgi:lactoylglutathione lyase